MTVYALAGAEVEFTSSSKFNVMVRPLTPSDPLMRKGPEASRVMVVVAVAAEVGPVTLEALVAPFAVNRGCTVPSPHPAAVTVRVVDDVSVPGSKLHPVALPALVKSPLATPVTASEKVSA